MDEKDIATLQNAEIDYEDIIDRFEGNESLQPETGRTGLLRRPPYMPNVRRAFAAGDLATAEMEAHALKGVAGNLSLTSVHKLAKSMNDALREGNEAAATKLLPQLDEGIRKGIVGALREVLGKVGSGNPRVKRLGLARPVPRRISRQGSEDPCAKRQALTPTPKAPQQQRSAVRHLPALRFVSFIR